MTGKLTDATLIFNVKLSSHTAEEVIPQEQWTITHEVCKNGYISIFKLMRMSITAVGLLMPTCV